MRKESQNDIHKIIKEKFGNNQLSDEKFSKQKYWDMAVSKDDEHSESARANPDILSDDLMLEKSNSERGYKLDFILNNSKILSKNEIKVLHLIMQGLSLTEIAFNLNIKKGSVQSYLNRAREKMLKLWRIENDE